jgi:hypothetical protein
LRKKNNSKNAGVSTAKSFMKKREIRKEDEKDRKRSERRREEDR